MATGVPKGFRHIWNYHSSKWDETKHKDKKGRNYWKVTWGAIKSKKSKSYGKYPKGFSGTWSLKGKQYIRKIGKGKYKTLFKGIKRPIKFKNPRRKRK